MAVLVWCAAIKGFAQQKIRRRRNEEEENE